MTHRPPNCTCHDNWVCPACESRIDAAEWERGADEYTAAEWDALESGPLWHVPPGWPT